MKKIRGIGLLLLLFFSILGLSAQEKNDSTIVDVSASSKTEKNRNVMLNAESATEPRDVNIGLPFRGDIVILENGVPVVYSFWPTIPTFAWNVDNSLSGMGLLSFEEGALLFGKVGYAVQSNDRDPGRKFQAFGSTYMSSVGSVRADLSLTGPIGKKGWGYMGSFYKSFDRGYGVNLMYSPWQSEGLNGKLSIGKKYKNGKVRLLGKYVESGFAGTAYFPMIYEGNGKVKKYPGFDLGKDAYMPRDGLVPYRDVMGDAKWANLSDDEFYKSLSYNLYLTGEHNFNKGWKLTYSNMYQHMKTPMIVEYPISLKILDASTATFYKKNSSDVYDGDHVQMMSNQLTPRSDITTFMSRFELTKKFGIHNSRVGATYQYIKRKYKTYSGVYLMSVEPNPVVLSYSANDSVCVFSGQWGSKTDDQFSKTALYASDDFKVGRRLELSLGARLELQNHTDHHNPYNNNEGLEDKELIEYSMNNKFNKVGYGKFVYKLTNSFGLLGDCSINTDNKLGWDYQYRDSDGKAVDEDGLTASEGGHPRTTDPFNYEIKVLKWSGGVYLNVGKKLSLVSKVTEIQKKHVAGSATLYDPESSSGLSADFGPEFYTIQTLGWSTDITAEPVKNFNIHYLLTLQNPLYKDYSVSGFGTTLTYSDKNIPSLSKVLMEIDPSYFFMKGKMRAWVSLRYFGEQASNETNAFKWAPRWENFGGLDYVASRKLTLKLSVVNFLDEVGAKGTIQGASQIDSDEDYIGKPIVANAIRPRTVEFKMDFKF